MLSNIPASSATSPIPQDLLYKSDLPTSASLVSLSSSSTNSSSSSATSSTLSTPSPHSESGLDIDNIVSNSTKLPQHQPSARNAQKNKLSLSLPPPTSLFKSTSTPSLPVSRSAKSPKSKPISPRVPSSTSIASKTGKRGCPQQFPKKLYDLLETEGRGLHVGGDKQTAKQSAAGASISAAAGHDNGLCIAWSPSGKGFQILNLKVFTATVLPLYFKTKKFSSFQRNLNLYGFSKVLKGEEKGCYINAGFRRGDYVGLGRIKKRGQLKANTEDGDAEGGPPMKSPRGGRKVSSSNTSSNNSNSTAQLSATNAAYVNNSGRTSRGSSVELSDDENENDYYHNSLPSPSTLSRGSSYTSIRSYDTTGYYGAPGVVGAMNGMAMNRSNSVSVDDINNSDNEEDCDSGDDEFYTNPPPPPGSNLQQQQYQSDHQDNMMKRCTSYNSYFPMSSNDTAMQEEQSLSSSTSNTNTVSLTPPPGARESGKTGIGLLAMLCEYEM